MMAPEASPVCGPPGDGAHPQVLDPESSGCASSDQEQMVELAEGHPPPSDQSLVQIAREGPGTSIQTDEGAGQEGQITESQAVEPDQCAPPATIKGQHPQQPPAEIAPTYESQNAAHIVAGGEETDAHAAPVTEIAGRAAEAEETAAPAPAAVADNSILPDTSAPSAQEVAPHSSLEGQPQASNSQPAAPAKDSPIPEQENASSDQPHPVSGSGVEVPEDGPPSGQAPAEVTDVSRIQQPCVAPDPLDAAAAGPLQSCEEHQATEAGDQVGSEAPPQVEGLADLSLPGPGPVPVPCTEHPEREAELASRPKRRPGGMALDNERFQEFLEKLRASCTTIGQADGRVLRLKQYIGADARTHVIDAVLDALADNTTVEALYIQNFEKGMHDKQLDRLVEVLTNKRIWALNVGENFEISLEAWSSFTKRLPETAVSFLYVSEHHLIRTNLKVQMRDAIRENRQALGPRDPAVATLIGNMWYNPKVAPGYSARAVARQKAGLERHGHLLRQRLPAGTVRKASAKHEKHTRQPPQRQARAVATGADSARAMVAKRKQLNDARGGAKAVPKPNKQIPRNLAKAVGRPVVAAKATSHTSAVRRVLHEQKGVAGAKVRFRSKTKQRGGSVPNSGSHHGTTPVAAGQPAGRKRGRPRRNEECQTAVDSSDKATEVPAATESPPPAAPPHEPLRTLEGVVMVRQSPVDPNKRQRRPTLRVQEALEAEPLFLRHNKIASARKRGRDVVECDTPSTKKIIHQPLMHRQVTKAAAAIAARPAPETSEFLPQWGNVKRKRSSMSRRPATRLRGSSQTWATHRPGFQHQGAAPVAFARAPMVQPQRAVRSMPQTVGDGPGPAFRAQRPAFLSGFSAGGTTGADISDLQTLLMTNQFIMQLGNRQSVGGPASQLGRQSPDSPAAQMSRQLAGRPAAQMGMQPAPQQWRQPVDSPAAQMGMQQIGSPASQMGMQRVDSPAAQQWRQPMGGHAAQMVMQPVDNPAAQMGMQPAAQQWRQSVDSPTAQMGRQPVGSPAAQMGMQQMGSPAAQMGRQPVGGPVAHQWRQAVGNPAAHMGMQQMGSPAVQMGMQQMGSPAAQMGMQQMDSPATQQWRQPIGNPAAQMGRQLIGGPAAQQWRQPVGSLAAPQDMQPIPFTGHFSGQGTIPNLMAEFPDIGFPPAQDIPASRALPQHQGSQPGGYLPNASINDFGLNAMSGSNPAPRFYLHGSSGSDYFLGMDCDRDSLW